MFFLQTLQFRERNVTFLEQEVTKLKLELASQTREIRNRESKHFQEIRQKD